MNCCGVCLEILDVRDMYLLLLVFNLDLVKMLFLTLGLNNFFLVSKILGLGVVVDLGLNEVLEVSRIFGSSGDSTMRNGTCSSLILLVSSWTTVCANKDSTLFDSLASANNCSIDWPLTSTKNGNISGTSKNFCKKEGKNNTYTKWIYIIFSLDAWGGAVNSFKRQSLFSRRTQMVIEPSRVKWTVT